MQHTVHNIISKLNNITAKNNLKCILKQSELWKMILYYARQCAIKANLLTVLCKSNESKFRRNSAKSGEKQRNFEGHETWSNVRQIFEAAIVLTHSKLRPCPLENSNEFLSGISKFRKVSLEFSKRNSIFREKGIEFSANDSL